MQYKCNYFRKIILIFGQIEDLKEKPQMSEIVSSKTIIAKNSIMLYIRMLFAMVVGLYTSRVVLYTLGQTDYGIYSLIGGLIGVLAFLNNTMSGASSRFLTFELGRNNKEKLSKTFDTILIIHIIIAIGVLVIAETFGLWFISSKLNIPPERMGAAHWVFQAVILSTLLSVIQVPYTSLIIAGEKMSVYAYFEILGICLRLAIVLLLKYIQSDKLIAYSLLLVLVSLIVFFCYRSYCSKHFEESRYSRSPDKTIMGNLLSFFGLNLFGNFGAIFNDQGLNVLLNKFFGLLYNAATGVATTVSNCVMALSSNTMTAYRPPIIKAYASSDFGKMEELMDQGLKLTYFLFVLFAIPVIVEADVLMRLWLKEVPPGAELFCRLMIVSLLVTTIRYFFIIGIHATGKVKSISIWNGLLLSANPFVMWLFLRHYPYVGLVYVGSIVANIILLFVVIILLNRLIPKLKTGFFVWSLIKMSLISVFVLFAVYGFSRVIQPGFLRLIASCFLSALLLFAGGYLLCLTKTQRELLRLFLRERLSLYRLFKRR